MSFTTKTPNYNFPQWSGTDYPSFVKDLNPAYTTIDSNLKTLNDNVNKIKTDVSSAEQSAQTAQQAAVDAQQAANNAVALLIALGVTDEATAIAFKNKVNEAVPKHAILASYFDTK